LIPEVLLKVKPAGARRRIECKLNENCGLGRIKKGVLVSSLRKCAVFFNHYFETKNEVSG
jgi:hypothetical protein